MKRVIICMTVYQLYNAINLRNNVFKKDDTVDIILIDKTNFSGIKERLIKEKIFNNVYSVNFDAIYQKNLDKICGKNKRFREMFLNLRVDMIFYRKTIHSLFSNTKIEEIYDEMYIANFSRIANMLFNMYYRKNTQIKIFFYEDAYVTYYKPLSTYKYLKKTWYVNLLNFLRIKQLQEKYLSGMYLYEPDLNLLESTFNILKLPKIDKNHFDNVEKLNKIFNYANDDFFDRKYIIFEQCYEIYNVTTNEFDLYEKIIDAVGEENVIVKLHPRTRVNRFEKYKKIKIYNEKVPWEIITLNQFFDSKVLISINSNAIITPIVLYGEKSKSIILQRLFEINDTAFIDDKIFDYFSKAMKSYPHQIKMPNNIDEMLILLKK